jgi:putative component of membrane protein insertase Oxa1/YidC/SpoIIIJ protein YidD
VKHLFILLIKGYWLIYPERVRRKCIFKESCSLFVYNKTKEGGFFMGINALKKRIKQCKPGYRIVNLPNGEKVVLLADMTIVDFNKLNL